MPKVPGPRQRRRDLNVYIFSKPGTPLWEIDTTQRRSYSEIITKMEQMGVTGATLRFEKWGSNKWTFSCYFKGENYTGWHDKAAPLYEAMLLRLVGLAPGYANVDFQGIAGRSQMQIADNTRTLMAERAKDIAASKPAKIARVRP